MNRLCLILFGPPGSGKGTQAKLAASRHLGLPHISTGDMLRERVARATSWGRKWPGSCSPASWCRTRSVNRMVEERIEQPDAAKRIYPGRLSANGGAGRAVDGDAAAPRDVRPVVVHLKVDYNVIIARLAGRRQCPLCGAVYKALNRMRRRRKCVNWTDRSWWFATTIGKKWWRRD